MECVIYVLKLFFFFSSLSCVVDWQKRTIIFWSYATIYKNNNNNNKLQFFTHVCSKEPKYILSEIAIFAHFPHLNQYICVTLTDEWTTVFEFIDWPFMVALNF